MTLNELKVGERARVLSVDAEKELRHHFFDMGLTPGTVLTLVKVAPLGDPVELNVRGYELTLRIDDAKRITVEAATEDIQRDSESSVREYAEHPHIGESGIYHDPDARMVIPREKEVVFALAGNQNCGKTTLFNQLTGSSQHVGNFPGVTVDRKDGKIRGENASVVDLPGIYSLSPFTNEEIVTRDFLLKDKPDGIINIIDATNIERNLYLTLQLLELNIPLVIALNMMDEVRENGGTINVNRLESILGVPVIPISASKNEGVDELIEHAIHVARYQEGPGMQDFCRSDGGKEEVAVHRCLHAIMHLVEDHAERAEIPLRFASSKLIEDDRLILDALQLDENEKETLDHIIRQLESEAGTDREAALADTRFSFIENVCALAVVKPKESKARMRSAKADRILTGRYTAIPAFLVVMAVIFYITFGPVGTALSNALEYVIAVITDLTSSGLDALGINPVVRSLVINGIFTGVGSVLSFLPVILILFFFLSILEDSGYMARISFVMDKALRRLGLSGRSFVPMLIGFGCSVPAIMATRTLSSERDRKMTILLVPFASCSAKLPIYALFTAAFFSSSRTLVVIGLYLIGIVVGIITALVLKKFGFRGNPVPFVLELPNYRMPTPKSVLQLMWQKTKDFVTKAFTVIFLASIIIWVLETFDWRLNVVTNPEESLLAMIGSLTAPLFIPLGFGDWRISTALITGFTAKESVVSTLTILLGGSTAAMKSLFTPLTAFVFLVFTLLYTPCIAAIATVKRELGKSWALRVVLLQCLIAWVVAWLVHLIGVLVL